MSDIELILTKLKIVSEEKEQGAYICDKEHSKILLDYIQQRENIIKEVREYLQGTINRWEDFEQFYEVVVEDKYILEILDKVGETDVKD